MKPSARKTNSASPLSFLRIIILINKFNVYSTSIADLEILIQLCYAMHRYWSQKCSAQVRFLVHVVHIQSIYQIYQHNDSNARVQRKQSLEQHILNIVSSNRVVRQK